MGASVNLRTNLDPNKGVELRKIWVKRCAEVDARKVNEKSVNDDNKAIIAGLVDMVGKTQYLQGATLVIKDTSLRLEKSFFVSRPGEATGDSFQVSMVLPSLRSLLRTDKTAKTLPKQLERTARFIDRVTKRAMKRHTIKPQEALGFRVKLETMTRYSF